MISTPDRQTANALINEAITAGARRAKVCAEMEISDRTLRRWTKGGEVHADQRPVLPRPEPANKPSAAERAAVLSLCNSRKFAELHRRSHAGFAAPSPGHSQRASARPDHRQACAGLAAVASTSKGQWRYLRSARARVGLHLQRQGAGAP